jgi:hypothetical protein
VPREALLGQLPRVVAELELEEAHVVSGDAYLVFHRMPSGVRGLHFTNFVIDLRVRRCVAADAMKVSTAIVDRAWSAAHSGVSIAKAVGGAVDDVAGHR